MNLTLRPMDYPLWASGLNVYRRGDPLPICIALTSYIADDIAAKLNNEHYRDMVIVTWTPSPSPAIAALPLEEMP